MNAGLADVSKLRVGAALSALETVGLTVIAEPSSVLSFGVKVKVGRSVPASIKAIPAWVKVTLRLPS